MKTFLKIVGGFAVVVVLLVLVGFALPRHYRVERGIVINGAPAAVHAQVADLRAWKTWGVWQERDPGMKVTYSEPATGVGAWSAWQSTKEGNGKMTITEVTPTRVIYVLEFPDFGTRSTGSIELVPEAGATRVVWKDEGDLGMNPMSRWLGLWFEGLIGPDFEKGLSNLKRLVEK